MPDHRDSSIEQVPYDAPQYQIAAKHPRRAEATVALAFTVALLAFVGFGVAYWVNARSELLGATLGVGMVAVGYGLVGWGKWLMPRGPFAEARHSVAPTRGERELIIEDVTSRGKVAIERRGFLGAILGAAVAVLSIVAAFPLLRSLGPLPKKTLYSTKWRKGSKLTTIDGKAVNVDFLDVGGVVTVFPPDDIGGAMSQTMLIRLADIPVGAPASEQFYTRPGRETWSPAGYIAYSKVCTHAGCPVALYQEQTQQLLCPCHQSLFNVLDGAEPVFGPAPRPLAQLPLYVDADGYLRAQRGYDEPVGPGFWERGND